jgi:branched-chain amino acid transport system permease protein
VARIIKQSSTNLAAVRDRLLTIGPGLAGLLGYPRANLPHDVVAGFAVAAVTVPVGIANAQLAGLPPATGLYASILPLVVYAIFGTSRQLIVGTSAAASALVASAIAPLAGGDPALYLELSMMLALIVGPFLMRLNGLQAGIATFALLGVVSQVLTYWSSIGPRSGQSMVGIPDVLNLQTTMFITLAVIVVAWLFQRTRPARLLRAAREDAIAAAASGINVVPQRVIAFAVSGVIAGVAGGMFALTNRVLQASQLGIELTFITLAMLVLGGVLSLSGAIVGALVFSLIDVVLVQLQSGIDIGSVVVSLPQGARPIILALLLIGMLLLRPSGLTGGREFVWPFRRKAPLPGTPVTND